MRRERLEVGGLVKSGVLQLTWLVFVIECMIIFLQHRDVSMYMLDMSNGSISRAGPVDLCHEPW